MACQDKREAEQEKMFGGVVIVVVVLLIIAVALRVAQAIHGAMQ